MTEPIVANCKDCDCEYNVHNDCKLDQIDLDINGTCMSRELKEEKP